VATFCAAFWLTFTLPLTVSYDGKSINYGSDAELANAISDLESRIATATTGAPRRRRWGTVASKGL
jgi:hypothetical protein